MSTALIIPIENAGTLGSFLLTTVLGAQVFTFEFQFNEREDSWYFNLYDNSNELVCAGVKVVINYPVLATVSKVNRPVGDIVFIDMRTSSVQSNPFPGLDDLGTVVVMGYVEL